MRKLIAILFDIWPAYIVTLFLFFFTFILPNLRNVVDKTVTVQGTNGTGYIDFLKTHTELSHNWVILGFRNIGFVIGGILVIVLLAIIIRGLYRWSHKFPNLD